MKQWMFGILMMIGFFSYGQSSDATLTTSAQQIKNETTAGANTAIRVGNMLQAIIDGKLSIKDYSTASGTNTYTATVSSAITSLAAGDIFKIVFTNGNSGASTLNLNSLGAKSIVKNGSTTLSSGDINAGQAFIVWYDGTNFQIIGGGGGGLSGTGYVKLSGTTPSYVSSIPNGDLTNSSITIAGNSTSLGGSVTQDNITGLSSTGLVKRTGANTLAVASSGSDYAPATSGTSILKGNGSGGFTNAVSNTDYQAPITFGTGVLTWLGTPSSANLASALTDKTGGGLAVFGTTPTLGTPVINGLPTGTGVASAATASTLVSRDANANIFANNAVPGYTTTTTSAGTLTLTVSSTYNQTLTGSTTHNVVMPAVSTLTIGHSFRVINRSSGTVTVKSSGSNTIQDMAGGTEMLMMANATSGTGASVWDVTYRLANPMSSVGQIIAGSTLDANGIPTLTAITPGAAGTVLTSNGASSLPSYQNAAISGLVAGRVTLSTASGTVGDDAGLTYDYSSTKNLALGAKFYIGGNATTPTARLHILGSTTSANTAPIKLTSGTNMTTAEAGALEYDGINFYATPSGTTRKTVMLSQTSRSTAQTAAVASVVTWTVGANDASFEVGSNVNLTASTTNSFTVTCTYTDETNTSRTVTFSYVQNGVATPIQTITNVTGVGAYAGMPMQIRCKAATTITIASTGTFTSVTYNIEGRITQLN